MEIRGERDKKRIRFDSLKEGEPFYYNGELHMKTNEITTTYNCVSLLRGKIVGCPDNAMVGIARVRLEKE